LLLDVEPSESEESSLLEEEGEEESDWEESLSESSEDSDGSESSSDLWRPFLDGRFGSVLRCFFLA
jgi:hypothetical protein